MSDEIFTQSTPASNDNDYQYHNGDDDDGSLELMPLRSLVPTLVTIPLVVAVAVGGNLLVLTSYALDPKLGTVSNLYVLHLAVCDLLLGAVSMPFYLVSTCLQQAWPFGKTFCKVYLVNDYTLCNQSVFLVILISLDQLLILRQGAHYSTMETKPKAYAKIVLAWLLAFLICGPAIIGWDFWVGYSVLGPDECDVEYYENKVYTFVEALLEFFVPAVILTAVNAGVYWEIRKRTKVTAEATRIPEKGSRARGAFGNGDGGTGSAPGAPPLKPAAAAVSTIESVSKSFSATNEVTSTSEQNWTPNRDNGNHSEPLEKKYSPLRLSSDNTTKPVTTSDDDLQAKTLPSGRSLAPLESGSYRNLPEVQGRPVLPGIRKETSDVDPGTSSGERDPTRPETHQAEETVERPAPEQRRELALSPETGPAANGCLTGFNGKQPQPQALAEKPQFPRATRRELKAAKALFIFVFTFVVLWAPYTIATVAIAFCEDCVNQDVYEFFVWLLWFKSAVNPFLYAANNSRFKMNFVIILRKVCFRWKQTRV